jgi:hypothetical protein
MKARHTGSGRIAGESQTNRVCNRCADEANPWPRAAFKSDARAGVEP